MKRELFRRPFRMVHRFGEGEMHDDPLGARTFQPDVPISPSQRHSRSLTVKKDGEYRYCEPLSPIVSTKTGRVASINGPAPDLADPIAQTIPAGTRKRKSP